MMADLSSAEAFVLRSLPQDGAPISPRTVLRLAHPAGMDTVAVRGALLSLEDRGEIIRDPDFRIRLAHPHPAAVASPFPAVYEGSVYVRSVGRGIVLEEGHYEGEQLEDWIEHLVGGSNKTMRLRITVDRLPEEGGTT